MALLLYRIGRLSFERRWPVLIAWLVLFAAALAAGLGVGGTMKESFAIPGTESQRALDRLEQVFPEVAGSSAQVVLEARPGTTIAEWRTEIAAVAERLGEVDHVIQALDPFSEYATGTLADDGLAALIQVQFDSDDTNVIAADAERVREIAADLEQHDLRVEFGGQIYQNLEYGLTVTEIIGVAFAAVVLIVAFGSVLAAGMPLASAIIAVGTTMGVLLVIARFAVVSSATPLLAVMIGLAVGIDYALFILSRHRHQLAKGADPAESAATAVGTSGSAVVFAGATVMVALLGLIIVGIPFLSVMGIAAAAGVLLALLTSVTLLPALLGFAGERLRPKPGSRAWRRETGADARPTMGRRWVRMVLRAPIVVVIAVIGVLGAIAVPALHMQTSLPSGKGEAVGATARDAYDIVTEHFGEGTNGPMLVMLDITQMRNETLMDDLGAISDLVAATPGVAGAGAALPNPTVDSAIIQVIPTTGPDDPATMDTVQALRDLAPRILDDYGAASSVTGATAVQIDITNRLNGALLPFAGVVVGLSFVLLMLVFRSLLVPAKAALSFLLSAFAAFGVVVLVFQDGVLGPVLGIVPGPIIAFLPVLLLAIVFGLAMDYEVFLVSGMREAHVRGAPAREAIEEGFANAARVVTAAALIMFAVFAAFVPEGDPSIKVIALGLAAGIFVDAFLVRMSLVPALMALFGERAWRLPAWLDRRLPNLDIEGEGLREYQEQAEWATQHRAAIALEELRVGDERRASEPVTADIAAGGLLVARGDIGARRVLAATLAGRLDPVSGRAQVLGRSLPGDAAGLVARVARVDVGDLDDRRRELALGQLLGRHAAFGTPMLRMEAPAARVDASLERLAAELAADGVRVTAATRLERLDPPARAIALVAVALAERPEALVLDLGGLGAAPDAPRIAARIIAAARRLAEGDAVALVLGAPAGFDAERLAVELGEAPDGLAVIDLGEAPRRPRGFCRSRRARVGGRRAGGARARCARRGRARPGRDAARARGRRRRARRDGGADPGHARRIVERRAARRGAAGRRPAAPASASSSAGRDRCDPRHRRHVDSKGRALMSATTGFTAARTRNLLIAILLPIALIAVYLASLGGATSTSAKVPALIVNSDRMVEQTNADGTTTPVVAGRLLVSWLTDPANAGEFDWTLANPDHAAAALRDGTAYVVVTIPDEFSASIVSAGSPEPRPAKVDVTTSQAHDYLTGAVSARLFDGLIAEFGQSITNSIAVGLADGIDASADGLQQAADGAGQLADGADLLGDGFGQYREGQQRLADGADLSADGAGQLADGAGRFEDGVRQFVDGVGTYAGGAGDLAIGVDVFADGVGAYADGAGDLATGIGDYVDGVADYTRGVDDYTRGVDDLADGLALFDDGMQQLADGAVPLSAAADQLGDMASQLQGASGDIETALGLIDDLAPFLEGLAGIDPTELYAVCDALAGTAPDEAEACTARIDDLIAALDASGIDQDAIIAGLGDLTDQLSGLSGAGDQLAELADGLGEFTDGVALAAEGSERLADGAGQLKDAGVLIRDGGTRLRDGGAEMAQGADDYADGGVALRDGGTTLADGAQLFADGGAQLVDGGTALNDGAAGITGGAGDLADGLTQLADGQQRLVDGGAPIADGIGELGDGVDDDVGRARRGRRADAQRDPRSGGVRRDGGAAGGSLDDAAQ